MFLLYPRITDAYGFAPFSPAVRIHCFMPGVFDRNELVQCGFFDIILYSIAVDLIFFFDPVYNLKVSQCPCSR